MASRVSTWELVPAAAEVTALASVNVEIGAIPIRIRPDHPDFCELLEQRYAGFLNPHAEPAYSFDIHLDSTGRPSDEDARVFRSSHLWNFHRGDFLAQWDPHARHGWLRQCPNPYAIDTVLRITHSLVLAEQGGFLVHAASAIRNGAAYLFAGVSGAGKTTMSRLAPHDATVLTDEISYIRKFGDGYRAYGTPFAGELARSGANSASSAPRALSPCARARESNRKHPATRCRACVDAPHLVLRTRRELTRGVHSVVDFVSRVEVSRLIFTPDARAWGLIG